MRYSFLSRIPATCNALLKKAPESDFFYSPSAFRSQVFKFANSVVTYILMSVVGGSGAVLVIYLFMFVFGERYTNSYHFYVEPIYTCSILH